MKLLKKHKLIFLILAFALFISGCSSNVSAPAGEIITPLPSSSPAPQITPAATIMPETPAEEKNQELTCSLSVRCDTVLNNMEKLNPEKAELIPSDCIIYPETVLEFTDGESVFDVLLREMKANKIHLEFVNAPVYGSSYIEGIGNLYEFDCGELSGWMYRVNDKFPNYGCSKYILKPGDKIEWIYTCNLGKDIGGENISQNQ